MLVCRAPLRAFVARGYRIALLAAIGLLFLITGSRPVTAAQTLHLPFPADVAVNIIQGYNGGTHSGVERYSLDLTRVDGKTSGAPAIAPAAGTVAFAQLPGQEHGCIGVAMDDSSGFHFMLCHLILDHVYSYGDRIRAGQSLGVIGAPGLVGNNGTSHIHMQLYTLAGGVRTPQPFAQPSGIPLEGVTMAADGTYNQWSCSGASCHNMVSRAPSSGNVTLADTASPSVSAAAPGNATLSVGQAAIVQGTGDCLRVRAQVGLSSATNGCAPDGSVVFVSDGPKQADGYTWWYLRTLGWSVADYLRPSGTPGSSSSVSPGDGGTPSAASRASPGIKVGSSVKVTGTEDCLRLRASPDISSAVVNCLTDGTRATVKDGPKQSDGHTWWLLDSGGWGVDDYLQIAAS